jgi:hypothetical protein
MWKSHVAQAPVASRNALAFETRSPCEQTIAAAGFSRRENPAAAGRTPAKMQRRPNAYVTSAK